MIETIELEMPTLKEVLEEAGGNEDILEKLTCKIRLWLKQQRHLPQNISDGRLRFVICSSKFNLEKVKKRLDLHYTIRNIFPEISNIDPLSDNVIQCCKYLQMIPLPKLTPQNYRLFMARYLNPDSFDFDVEAVCKYAYMLLETLVEEDLVTSDVIILDGTDLRLSHALKFTPSVLKRAITCVESYGRRIKAIHMINVPEFIDWILSIMKTVINAKIFKRIHVHTSGIESLYGIVPKSILPADYGGEQPSTDIIAAMWQAKLTAQREWFLAQAKVRADESLRSNSTITPNDIFGIAGTFQKLDID